jgi:protein-disulfide isomerase
MNRTVALLLACIATLAPGAAKAKPPWQSISWWADLDTRERGRVEKLAGEKQAYGDCDGTVAACFERGSKSGKRLAKVIIYLVQKGAADEDVGRILDQRKAAATAKPKVIELSGAPCFGPPAAPLVVAEFADFECPFCARVTPVLKEVVGALHGKARLHFKHFPLKTHATSLPASLAAAAAHRAGRFWEMAALLFGNMEDHQQKHLESYAQKVGIALETFRGLCKDPATMQLVVKDKEAGLRLGVSSTPAVYVNGREVHNAADRFLLQDALEEELERLEARK